MTYKRLEIKHDIMKKDKIFGRFGGGWNWKVGIQVGGSCMIISWLVGSTRITWRKLDEKI